MGVCMFVTELQYSLGDLSNLKVIRSVYLVFQFFTIVRHKPALV